MLKMDIVRCAGGGEAVLLCGEQGCQERPFVCVDVECRCWDGHGNCGKVRWEDLWGYVKWKNRVEGIHQGVSSMGRKVRALGKVVKEMGEMVEQLEENVKMTEIQKLFLNWRTQYNWERITQKQISYIHNKLPQMQTVQSLQTKFIEIQGKMPAIKSLLRQINFSLSSNKKQKPSGSCSPQITSKSSSLSDGYRRMASTKKKIVETPNTQIVNLINENQLLTFGDMEHRVVEEDYDDRMEFLVYKKKYEEDTVNSLRKKGRQLGSLDLSLSSLLDDSKLSKILSSPNWPFLSSINLSNCRITDKSSSFLANTPAAHLFIGGNWLTDSVFTNLSLNNVITLNLCFTYVTDKGIEVIVERMQNCRVLDLSYTKVTTKGVVKLKGLRSLVELYVWGGWKYLPRYKDYKYYNRANNLNKQQNHRCELESLLPLQNSFKLKSLCMNPKQPINPDFLFSNLCQSPICLQLGGPLHKSIIDKIIHSQYLKQIYLQKCDLEGCRFKSRFLKSVSLVRCKISGYLLDNTASGMLEVLDLRYSTAGEFGTIALKISRMHNLTELYLCKSETTINDTQLELITKSVQKLEILDLSSTRITDAGLEKLATENLKVLNLSKTKITDTTINNLQLTVIHSLYLTQTPVTEAILPTLTQLPTLCSLWASYTKIPPPLLSTLPSSIRVFQ